MKEAFDKFDNEFCGRTAPDAVRSNGVRLSMVFSSGATQGSGFKADFNFETGEDLWGWKKSVRGVPGFVWKGSLEVVSVCSFICNYLWILFEYVRY